MSINFTDLQDAVVALIAIVGIAIVLSGTLILAARLWRRDHAHTHQAVTVTAAPAQQPVQLDDARELVLR